MLVVLLSAGVFAVDGGMEEFADITEKEVKLHGVVTKQGAQRGEIYNALEDLANINSPDVSATCSEDGVCTSGSDFGTRVRDLYNMDSVSDEQKKVLAEEVFKLGREYSDGEGGKTGASTKQKQFIRAMLTGDGKDESYDGKAKVREMFELLSDEEDKEQVRNIVKSMQDDSDLRKSFVEALATTGDGYDTKAAAKNVHELWSEIPNALGEGEGVNEKVVEQRQEVIDKLLEMNTKQMGDEGVKKNEKGESPAEDILEELMTSVARGNNEGLGDDFKFRISSKLFSGDGKIKGVKYSKDENGESLNWELDGNMGDSNLKVDLSNIPDTGYIAVSPNNNYEQYGGKGPSAFVFYEGIGAYNQEGITFGYERSDKLYNVIAKKDGEKLGIIRPAAGGGVVTFGKGHKSVKSTKGNDGKKSYQVSEEMMSGVRVYEGAGFDFVNDEKDYWLRSSLTLKTAGESPKGFGSVGYSADGKMVDDNGYVRLHGGGLRIYNRNEDGTVEGHELLEVDSDNFINGVAVGVGTEAKPPEEYKNNYVYGMVGEDGKVSSVSGDLTKLASGDGQGRITSIKASPGTSAKIKTPLVPSGAEIVAADDGKILSAGGELIEKRGAVVGEGGQRGTVGSGGTVRISGGYGGGSGAGNYVPAGGQLGGRPVNSYLQANTQEIKSAFSNELSQAESDGKPYNIVLSGEDCGPCKIYKANNNLEDGWNPEKRTLVLVGPGKFGNWKLPPKQGVPYIMASSNAPAPTATQVSPATTTGSSSACSPWGCGVPSNTGSRGIIRRSGSACSPWGCG